MKKAGLDHAQTEGISEYLRNAHRVGAMSMEERAQLASTWFMAPGIDQARALDVFKSADRVLTHGIEACHSAPPTPAADRQRLAEIEQVMKTDFRQYYQNREMQAEYTEILERQHPGTQLVEIPQLDASAIAPAAAAAAAVVAQAPAGADRRQEIERAMYTGDGKPGPYWSDVRMQAEYLALSAPATEGTKPSEVKQRQRRRRKLNLRIAFRRALFPRRPGERAGGELRRNVVRGFAGRLDDRGRPADLSFWSNAAARMAVGQWLQVTNDAGSFFAVMRVERIHGGGGYGSALRALAPAAHSAGAHV